MKRKLDKSRNEENSSTSSAKSNSSQVEQKSAEEFVAPEVNDAEHCNKRLRCADTPPPEPEDLDLPQINARNRHLLEAIQLKMLELQNELDAFEQDFEAHEVYIYNENSDEPSAENAAPQAEPQMSEQEAEALGFAMCAQETMLFLQREGISRESILYTRLREALVGRGTENRDRIFQL